MLRRAVQLPPLAERGARERHRTRLTRIPRRRDLRVAANLRRRAQNLSDIANWTVLVFDDELETLELVFHDSRKVETSQDFFSKYSDSNR